MSGGVIVLDGVELALRSATLDSYHDDTDWNLRAEAADGRTIAISGIAEGPLVAGSRLKVQFFDQPTIVVDGADGMLVPSPDPDSCVISVASADVARIELEGALIFDWVSTRWEGPPSRPFSVRVAIDADRRRGGDHAPES